MSPSDRNDEKKILTTAMQDIEQSYTLSDYVSAIKRRKRVFFGIAIPIALVAFVVAIVLPNEYRSVARIGIDLEGSTAQTLEPIQVSAYADQYLAELRDRVLDGDNLQPFVENPENFPESVDELSFSERMSILRSGFYFALQTQPVMSQGGREVDIITGFRTGFQGYVPEFAHKAGRFFASSFMREDRERRTQAASSTSDFLEEQIRTTEAEVSQYEAEMADFKTLYACCLPELKDLNLTIIQRAERDIETLQPRIRSLEQNRQFLLKQIEELRGQSDSRDRLAELEDEYLRLVANYGPDHPDVARARREIEAITAMAGATGDDELLRLRMELAEAERRYSDIHPDVISLRRRIAALETDGSAGGGRSATDRLIENPRYIQLRSELNSVENELGEVRSRLPELRARIRDYEDRLTRTPQVESEFQALNRKLQTARETYDNLQRRLVLAQQTEALESTDIGARLSLIRAARIPSEPVGPPRIAITMLGVLLAATIGIGLTIFVEMIDSTIRNSKDVVNSVQIVPIATIPVIQNSAAQTASRRQIVATASLSLVIVIGIAYFLVRNMT